MAVRPIFSAIICTHDRPEYLRACLEGLKRQTAPENFEVLVVDSATPGENAAKIAAITAAVPGARLIRLEQAGVSLARNTGARAASTPWAAYLDDDAVPEESWAARMAERLANIPDDVAVIGGRIKPHWEASFPNWWPEHWVGALTIIEEETSDYIPSAALPPHVQPFGANMAVRIAPLQQVGGFPERLGRVGKNLLSCEEPYAVRRLELAGFRIFYDGNICVRHSIQAHRLSSEWILSRVHWQGISDAAMARLLGNRIKPRIKALWMLMRNSYRIPWLSIPSSSHTHISRRCSATYALGYLRGAYAPRL